MHRMWLKFRGSKDVLPDAQGTQIPLAPCYVTVPFEAEAGKTEYRRVPRSLFVVPNTFCALRGATQPRGASHIRELGRCPVDPASLIHPIFQLLHLTRLTRLPLLSTLSRVTSPPDKRQLDTDTFIFLLVCITALATRQ